MACLEACFGAESMNLTRNFLLLVHLGLVLAAAVPEPAHGSLLDGPVSVRFSPHGGAEALVVEALDAARRSVQVQAYSFTSMPIALACKRAHDRGVAIRVILDKSQVTQRYSDLGFLVRSGVPVWVDAAHAIAHNKIVIIDGETVLTGSFNFTKAAETSNAENLLCLRDAGLAAAYGENWERHLAHSHPALP